MEDRLTHSGYKEVLRNANALYRKIGRIWCPRLEDWVAFNNVGFHHLIWQGRRHRSIREQKRRFAILAYAAGIVGDPASTAFHERKPILDSDSESDTGIVANFRMTFWTLTAQKNNEVVTVVIRQAKHGKKHFFSIYSKKTKIAQLRAVFAMPATSDPIMEGNRLPQACFYDNTSLSKVKYYLIIF